MGSFYTWRRILTALALAGASWIYGYFMFLTILVDIDGDFQLFGLNGLAEFLMYLLIFAIMLVLISTFGLGKADSTRFKLIFALFAPIAIVGAIIAVWWCVGIVLIGFGIL